MASAQDVKFQSMKNQRDYLIQRRDGAGGITQSMSVFKRDSDEYKKLLKEYKETTKLIDSLEVKIKPLQIAADNVQAGKDATKEKEKTDKAISLKQEELAKAKDRNDAIAIEKIEKEISNISTSKSNDSNTAGTKQYDGDNDFVKDVNAKGLSLTNQPDGSSWVSGEEGGDNTPQYIYIGPETRTPLFMKEKAGQLASDYTPSTSDFDVLRRRIIQDSIKSPRGLKGLFDDLRGAGLKITQKDYNTLDTTSSSFGKSLAYALQKHTKAMVDDLEQNKNNINPKSFFKYMQEDLKDSGIGGPEVSYNEYATKRDEAESDLNRFFMDNLGRGASNEELNKYYKDLRALEKKNAQVTTKTETDSGGTSEVTTGKYKLGETDILELQRKIAGKALDGSDVDVIVKGGSKAAQDINKVLAYAKEYGVAISNKDALGYVANELKLGQKDMAKVNAKLLAISKATYSNLSDVLSEDVSLKDLAYNYRNSMQEILEIDANQIDTMDRTIQTALKNNGNKGAMNLTEFERLLKQDARWGKTSNARETASNYANNILKSFGLIA